MYKLDHDPTLCYECSTYGTLVAAVKAADLYLNSYDTSRPSRIKAETRALIEEAIAALKGKK